MRGWAALALAAAAFAGPVQAGEYAAGTTAEVRFVDAFPRGPSVTERLVEIRRRIQAALVYPPLARRKHVEGEAIVRFEVSHDGAARQVSLHRTSGRPSLDRAATRAVAAAAPLPWVWGRLEIPVRFELHDAADRRRGGADGGT
ncbi:MAG: TonB family protein [Myxococcota bacterium]